LREPVEKHVPKWKYSVTGLDPDKTVKCAGRELHISPKATVEICTAIRGMKVAEAKELLEQVSAKKKAIPYKRHKKEVPHKSLDHWHAGRYPVKAASTILKLLEGLEANAEYKGLNVTNLRIIHASSQRGIKIRKYTPRAFGRSSPSFNTLTHLEIVGYESE
jgi:large subunit ribosomal protein L22